MRRFLVTLAALLIVTQAAPAQLIVSSYFNSAVYNYSPSGGGFQGTYIPPFASGVNSPSRITVGPDNNLYISNQGTDSTNNSILKYEFSTGNVTTLVSAASLQTVAGAGNYYAPAGIRFGSDGSLYVARNGGLTAPAGSGAIDKFTSSGAFVSTVAGGFHQPTAITINGSDLYVSNLRGPAGPTASFGSVDRIANFATTPVTNNFVAATSGGLENPTGTTFGPDGKFYVADVSYVQQGFGCKVLRYNADGSFDVNFAQPAAGLIFTFPSDVLFREDGKLLVAGLGFPGNFPGIINLYSAAGNFEQQILNDMNVSPSALAFVPVPEPGLLLLLGGVLVVRRARR